MKILQIIGAAIAGLYSLAQLIHLPSKLSAAREGHFAFGNAMGGVAGALIGAAICLALIKSSRKKSDVKSHQSKQCRNHKAIYSGA
jgi:hypothetical protein